VIDVNLDQLEIGKNYDRPHLAELWGYKGFQAISRGVVTPANSNFIILFVTKEKQQALTQYRDFIDGDVLFWEGEEGHRTDLRIARSSSSIDAIHLFYRERHHSPFVYYGEIHLINYRVNTTRPSEFEFSVRRDSGIADIFDEIESRESDYSSLDKTEKDAVVKSRIGQGIFRDRLIDLWKACSVTDIENLVLLRASHIKPWKDSTNSERLSQYNGLLLIPNLDHLFDSGLISFNDTGELLISNKLSAMEVDKLGLDKNSKLRKIPVGIKKNLRYHRENVFKST